VNRAISLHFAGNASGYGTATYVYGPEVPRVTQIQAAKSLCQSASSGGSGYRIRVEIWSDFYTRQIFSVRYPGAGDLGPK